jgi:hypothetical protein
MFAWLRSLLAAPQPEQPTFEQECRDRWLKINAETKAAGCRCGKPATHVRRFGGTVGGVASEVWSCEEHQNVNGWSRSGDSWVPSSDFGPEHRQWEVG